MNLLERISQELKTAMLQKEADRLSTLRLLKSAIGYAQIERKNENLSEAELVAIVQKEVKKRQDAAEQFDKGGRPELAAKERREIEVLTGFLPKPLTSQELEDLVKAAVQESGATSKKEMGQVIKLVQAKASGRADGRAISAAVAKALP